MHFQRKYDYYRVTREDLEVIRGLFNLIRNIIAKYWICDKDIYKFNEIGFIVGVIFIRMVVISSDGQAKAKKI